ncbi:putative Cytochrome c55X [Oleispira antarctica RB-8]|uniref:Putative Cytochrome c55X n=1 Tax=Oleispira antarctica RB-8 TaxID=698738 RepID=R4YU69_OLEAN|nr:putative Cytochrome c55X [Oleispira antarctica RB-8]
MTIKRLISTAITVMIVSAAVMMATLSHAEIPSHERQQELTHLLKQDCGSCHGMTMKGGLGPALLPENLADTPNYILVNTIKYGRETLAMPAWDNILTTAEIEWLVAELKDGRFLGKSDRKNN